jgi:hypothetical protein
MRERKSLPVQGTEDRIVLYAYEDCPLDTANLMRARPDGSIVWAANPPEAQDAWVDVAFNKDTLLANSWSCWQVSLSLATGAEIHREFTK